MKRSGFVASMRVAVVAAVSQACTVMGSGASGPAPVSLAGNWTLDVSESSDTSLAAVRGLVRGTRAAPDNGGSATRPGGTYPERLRTARVDDDLAERVLAATRVRSDHLTIADSAGVITLRTGERAEVRVTPGARSARQTWLDGTTGELRARWVQQRLEIVRRLDGGITVQEYYARSPGGSRLVVFSIVKGPFDGEKTRRLVYNETATS